MKSVDTHESQKKGIKTAEVAVFRCGNRANSLVLMMPQKNFLRITYSNIHRGSNFEQLTCKSITEVT